MVTFIKNDIEVNKDSVLGAVKGFVVLLLLSPARFILTVFCKLVYLPKMVLERVLFVSALISVTIMAMNIAGNLYFGTFSFGSMFFHTTVVSTVFLFGCYLLMGAFRDGAMYGRRIDSEESAGEVGNDISSERQNQVTCEQGSEDPAEEMKGEQSGSGAALRQLADTDFDDLLFDDVMIPNSAELNSIFERDNEESVGVANGSEALPANDEFITVEFLQNLEVDFERFDRMDWETLNQGLIPVDFLQLC